VRKLIFRGVVIRYLDMRAKDGILFSRLHLTADMTAPVAEEMGWEAALHTDGWDSMKLAGAIRLAEVTMKVSGLSQELRMKAEEARDFIGLRISADDGTVTHVELRFLLVTADHPALVYEYWKAVGDGKAELRATLQDEPQADLALEEPKADEDDDQDAEPPLASRAQMEKVGA